MTKTFVFPFRALERLAESDGGPSDGADRFELGVAVGDDVFGGNYYHVGPSVNEAYNSVRVMGDTSLVNYIEYVPYEEPDDDEPDDVDFEPYYEIEAMDVNGETLLIGCVEKDSLRDYFSGPVVDKITHREGVRKECNGGYFYYRLDDLAYMDTCPSDVNDVDEVNGIARRISDGGPSCYILTDGTEACFQDHVSISNIDGMTVGKFLELGAIRIGSSGGIELIRKPTDAQVRVLRDYVRVNGGCVKLDIAEYSGSGQYPGHVCSAQYFDANPNRVVNDIIAYFRDGIRPTGYGIYGENVELEVDSSEVDLSSFRIQDGLAPRIWEDGELNPRVRLRLLDIADDFWEFVDIPWVKPEKTVLIGSICNYNWSKFSDIDLHVVVDFSEIDEKVDFVKQYLDAKKNEWNESHDGLMIYGFKVELYAQDIGEEPDSGAMYDLDENKWIKKPVRGSLKPIGLSKFKIKDKAAEIMTIIDAMYDELGRTDDAQKISEIGEDASALWKKVKDMRRDGLAKNGEGDPGNITYKCLRRTGYFDKLWDLMGIVYDRENSISENLILREYLEKDYNYPLYRYFKYYDEATSEQKAESLAYHCPWAIEKYIPKVWYRYAEFGDLLGDDGEFNKDVDESVEDFLSLLKKNGLCDHFISVMSGMVDCYELPAWMFVDYIRPVKNEWCIHFGNDAELISQEGFTGGTNDLDNLAYTNAGSKKPTPGYNFAFTIDNRKVDYAEYGEEAVIFRTSGVEIYHYGDNENQVIFYGPNAKEFIYISHDGEGGDWCVRGKKGNILKSGSPSEIAAWATANLPQYRKSILSGKSGYIPKRTYYDKETGKFTIKPLPFYRNESSERIEGVLNEEFAMDGSSEGNPYKEHWEAEREALKKFICDFGVVMQSREDNKEGRLYKCFYDKGISSLIGYGYCLCVQWDEVEMKPKSIVYIRAWDKFTPNIRRDVMFDGRGRDNTSGTYDDTGNTVRSV